MLADFKKGFLGFEKIASFPGDIYVLFTLSSIVFFYGGYPFLQGVFDELRSTK